MHISIFSQYIIIIEKKEVIKYGKNKEKTKISKNEAIFFNKYSNIFNNFSINIIKQCSTRNILFI